MSNKLKPIEELKVLLGESKREHRKPLLERYFDDSFDDDYDVRYEDESEEDMGSGDKLAKAKGILPVKKEIDEIRKIALQTIARLAEDPTSESYQMMKKIWVMCDKALESALQGGDDREDKKFK